MPHYLTTTTTIIIAITNRINFGSRVHQGGNTSLSNAFVPSPCPWREDLLLNYPLQSEMKGFNALNLEPARLKHSICLSPKS